MIDEGDVRQFQQVVKDALRPDVLTDLDRDLWPRMRERLAVGPPRPSLLDWALLAAIVGAAASFPRVMLGVLYNL